VDPDRRAVDALRGRLRRAGVIVKTVGSPEELEAAVLHALQDQKAEAERRRSSHGQPVSPGGPVSRDRPAATTSPAGGPPWMAPPLDRMVDRRELGERLLEALLAPGAGEVGLTTGLHGAGGFGKTRLATWACHQPRVRQRYPGGLLWATVGQEGGGAQLAERVNDLAYALSGQRPALSDPDNAGAELGRLLEGSDRGPVLLVVDDVAGAGQAGELADLVGDLRWVEASTALFGTTLPAEAGLALAGTASAATLARALAQAGHLLAPFDDIPGALGATLASRLDGVPGLETAVATYRARLPRPRLEPRWPLPDRPHPAHLRTLTGHTYWVNAGVYLLAYRG
jgi:hypothetical protein